jgi:hypothetical protein
MSKYKYLLKRVLENDAALDGPKLGSCDGPMLRRWWWSWFLNFGNNFKLHQVPEVTRILPVTSKFFVNRHSEANSDKLTLFDFQLDEQNSSLFTYNTFIKILYMFRALPCSSSGGLRGNCIYAASGIVILCR